MITFATPVRLENNATATGCRARIEFIDKLSNRDFFYLHTGVRGDRSAVGIHVGRFYAFFYFFNLVYLYYRMRSRPS